MVNDLGISEYMGDIELSDNIFFDFDQQNQIAIEDVIIHLQGLEKIGKKIPLLLEKILGAKDIKGVSFRYAKLEIERIEAGSLFDVIKLKLEAMITGDTNPELKKKVWKDIEEMKPQMLVGLLVGAVAQGAVCTKCASQTLPESFFGVSQGFAVNIGSTFNISSEKVLPLLQETANKATAEDVRAGIHFLRPAKSAGGNIRFSSDKNLGIEVKNDIIEQTPEDYAPPQKTDEIVSYKKTNIQIRAQDMDHPEKGWYAIIPTISETRRIKLELGPEINPMDLSNLSVTGNLDVTYKVDPKGKKTISKALLTDIVK